LFIFLVLLNEQIIEALAFHFILEERVTTKALIIIQALHAYGILYLIGDYNLLRNTRITVTHESLLISVGARKSVKLKLSLIKDVRFIQSKKEINISKNTFWASATPRFYKYILGDDFMDTINCQLSLQESIEPIVNFGHKRKINYINLSVDEVNEFIKEIELRRIKDGYHWSN
jgi:hypothetical protein